VTLHDADELWLLLAASSAVLTDPLSTDEIHAIEDRFGFSFGPDHRELLAVTVPTGPGWPDWRHGSEEDLRGRLDWPVDGVLYDVEHNAFWPSSWGHRPEDLAAAAPAEPHSPVFSVYQTDTIYYGRDLEDYLMREFARGKPRGPVDGVRVYIPFWAELAESRESDL
jgi:hypothetical protein